MSEKYECVHGVQYFTKNGVFASKEGVDVRLPAKFCHQCLLQLMVDSSLVEKKDPESPSFTRDMKLPGA
jgi:hypothetical protein